MSEVRGGFEPLTGGERSGLHQGGERRRDPPEAGSDRRGGGEGRGVRNTGGGIRESDRGMRDKDGV